MIDNVAIEVLPYQKPEIYTLEQSIGNDLQSLTTVCRQITSEGSKTRSEFDDSRFASYTAQKLIEIFSEERELITGELDKFESSSGTQRAVLHSYITKNKESAHARMVAGICVSGDNPGKPGKHPRNNMWDMPNYLQLVFQEPDTLQCQGLVLMHHFQENGQKILAVSLNPSSTYLYSVDEQALFRGIMGILEEFATENGFDRIVVSQNKTIRTNRTGGVFE